MLKGKKIVLGITGSIAAYKTATLVRFLVKEQAEVKVVMTNSATQFITPLTLSVLSKNPVLRSFEAADKSWNNHVELGLWADLIIIAPASANTIAKMANGICDNLLLACYLSAKCPIVIAPAMDRDMYLHPSTQKNLVTLQAFGNLIIPPNDGELASGLLGMGRMAEPEEISAWIRVFLAPKKSKLTNRTILINAGPTREAIDPVRYISNHSTGKMGYAIAEEAAKRGANVILVSGITHCKANNANIKVIHVISASEMTEACLKQFENADVTILTAAVADYSPKNYSSHKIKKEENNLSLELVKNIDIAKELGMQKSGKQIIVGFALETNNEVGNAKTKITQKNLDLIVLNSLNDAGAGFGADTNKIKILNRLGEQKDFELKSKSAVAKDILDEIELMIS